MSLDTFIAILLKVLEIVLVVVVVGGILSIVWNKTNATPQDQDFKRILDAEEKIEKDFEDKEIASEQYFTVPIVSENPMQIAFYPEGGIVIPHKCKGKTCICMYYITTGGKKETCKTIDIKGECTSFMRKRAMRRRIQGIRSPKRGYSKT